MAATGPIRDKRHIREMANYYLKRGKLRNCLLIVMGVHTGHLLRLRRIVDEAAAAVGLAHDIGCHSLRKSLGYHEWQSGVQAVLLMDIFNHSSFAVTKRYAVGLPELLELYMNATENLVSKTGFRGNAVLPKRNI